MLTKSQSSGRPIKRSNLHRYISRPVLLTDAKGRQMRGRVLLPVRASAPKHPLADSIGAFTNDAQWDDFTAELDAYRKKQDAQEY